jgi:HEAT repeat protein
VRDAAPEVREAAVRAAASFGVDEIAIPLVRALGSEHHGVVANAAQALATLGDDRAVVYLIRRVEGHGSSPSAYFASVEQISYIQDFDVEVATTSFIADPIVGTIQQGAVGAVTVLDAMIQKTTVQRILLDAAGSLAGTKFASPGEALAWYEAHAEAFPGFTRRAAADEPN